MLAAILRGAARKLSKKVAVIGLPFFARRTASALRGAGFDAHFVPQPEGSLKAWPGVVASILAADLVYAIGSSISRNSPVHLISLLGKTIVMHWVGTDVQVAFDAYSEGVLSERLIDGATHWADAPWLVDELSILGIQAAELLLPVPAAIGSPVELPTRFKVLIYLPREFQSAYNVEGTLHVVRALPDVSFMVAGGYRPPEPIPNLEVLGFVNDMPSVYARSTALLRLTYHDGMSHSVIEALSFGRHVGWGYPVPGGQLVSSPTEAIEYIRELSTRFAAGTLAVNLSGAESVIERYSPRKMLDEVRRGLGRALDE